MLKDLKINLHQLDRAQVFVGARPMEVRYDLLESTGVQFRLGADAVPGGFKLIHIGGQWAGSPQRAHAIDEDTWARVEHGVLTDDGGVL